MKEKQLLQLIETKFSNNEVEYYYNQSYSGNMFDIETSDGSFELGVWWDKEMGIHLCSETPGYISVNTIFDLNDVEGINDLLDTIVRYVKSTYMVVN